MIENKIERVCKKLENFYEGHLICKPGCSQCCEIEPTVFSLEAFFVGQQLLTLSPQRIKKMRARLRNNDEKCPMLWNNLCVIYPARPIICRTRGFPIYYTEAEITFIDYCRLNFTTLSENYKFRNEYVLKMTNFNEKLVQLDQQFTEQVSGKLWHPDNRISLRKILKDLDLKNLSC